MLGKFVTAIIALGSLFCEVATAETSLGRVKPQDSSPLYFKENYLVVEMVKNQAFGSSQTRFSPGNNSVFAGFRHILRDHWLMGVHLGFKKFRVRGEERDLSLFTVLQETQLLYRLNHPFYLSLGPKLMMLLPTKGNKIPPEREKQYTREVGMAGSLSLHYTINKYVIFSLRVDRWRGVGTEIFQGTESAVGLNIALP